MFGNALVDAFKDMLETGAEPSGSLCLMRRSYVPLLSDAHPFGGPSDKEGYCSRR